MVTLAIVSKTDLGNGKVAVTVKPRLGHVDPQTGVAHGKELVLIVPSGHKLAMEEQYFRDTGERFPNGNPRYELATRPKSIEELSEVDILELLADITERITALELLVK